MCGIVGAVLVKDGNVVENLLKPLQRLEYRGYDSCGYFAAGDYRCNVGSVQSLIERAETDLSALFIQGIAHTRWATHGEVNVKNAHPQDAQEAIYVVHNGVVDNYAVLKEKLISKGCEFNSETDTEVIAHLIAQYVIGIMGVPGIDYPTSTAVCMAMEDLKGKFSFIALDDLSATMVAVCNGRPLIIFRNHVGTFIASDVAAFQGMDSGEIYFMKDGEVVEFNGNVQKARRVSLVNGVRVQQKIEEFVPYTPESIENEAVDTTIMLTEIKQQPQAVEQTMQTNSVEEIIGQVEHVLFQQPTVRQVKLIGCGTSYHAAQMGAKWLKMIANINASAHIASEFGNQSSVDSDTDLFIFLSQSGETADTLAALDVVSKYAPKKMISVCNTEHSELVRRCQYNIATRAGIERSVASTKAFTAQLIALLKFAIAIAKLTKSGIGSMDFMINDLQQSMSTLSEQVSATIDANMKVATAVAKYFKRAPKQAIFLGRESMYPIALEGALKLAEIAYIPSLTYFTGELKHGPLALVDKKTPVFCVFSSGEANMEKMFSALKQVEARGGQIFLVTDKEGFDEAQKAGVKYVTCLLIPSLNRYKQIFQPITAMIPLQLVAHEIAYFLGRNVDRPRNLAKSVTVE